VSNLKAKYALAASLIVAISLVAPRVWAADQPPQIPTCDKKIGTLAVTEPENKW